MLKGLNLKMPATKFKLKQRDIAIIALILSIALAAFWWQFMRKPSVERMTSLKSDIKKIEADVATARRAKNDLPALREEIAELERERLAFLAELPLEDEIAELVDRLRASSVTTNVLMTNLGTSSGGSRDTIQGVRPIGFSVSTRGEYGNTLQFLSHLERFQRFTKISQVGFSVDNQGEAVPQLNTNYDFTVYAFTGSDPGPGDE